MFTLVTGGSGSGKSEYAESLADSWNDPKIYVATMMPFDEETGKKIQRHRAMRRDKGFVTVECFTGLSASISRRVSCTAGLYVKSHGQ